MISNNSSSLVPALRESRNDTSELPNRHTFKTKNTLFLIIIIFLNRLDTSSSTQQYLCANVSQTFEKLGNSNANGRSTKSTVNSLYLKTGFLLRMSVVEEENKVSGEVGNTSD